MKTNYKRNFLIKNTKIISNYFKLFQNFFIQRKRKYQLTQHIDTTPLLNVFSLSKPCQRYLNTITRTDGVQRDVCVENMLRPMCPQPVRNVNVYSLSKNVRRTIAEENVQNGARIVKEWQRATAPKNVMDVIVYTQWNLTTRGLGHIQILPNIQILPTNCLHYCVNQFCLFNNFFFY